MHIHIFHPSTRRLFPLVTVLMLLLNACSFSLLDIPGLNSTTSTPAPLGPTSTPLPSAAATFTVALPSPLLNGETLYLSVVDEITGLGLNAVNYPMQGMDAVHYTVNLPVALGSVVKYRYVRQAGLPIQEDDSAEKAVRYRMFLVNGPGSVSDIVSSWTDSLYAGSSGRLAGQIKDASTGAAIPNILIAAGGQQTLTDSSGGFVIEGLPEGTHNLVAYAIDGAYQTFQQGAVVLAGKSTVADLSLTPSSMVNVIFTVTAPEDTIANTPIRFAGNLYQFGNTFGDLDGGLSSVATRMPILTPTTDGRYTFSVMLPAGADIRYKYSLGDGFWNAEHNGDGTFVVRQLVVPSSADPVQVQDAILTWQSGDSAPILFELTAPDTTPVSDIISIQFNPYGWTEPIPMWPLGNNRWMYQLHSPLNMLGDFEYRYCRNDQCGVADDTQTSDGHRGRLVSTSLVPQDLQDTVSSWTWSQNVTNSLVGLPVTARSSEFWAGVEFLPDYDPTWQAWTPQAIQNVQGLYANWLVLDPSWSVTRSGPFAFAPLPGADPLWADNLDTISRARASNLSVALFPQANLPDTSASWWSSAPRSGDWWEAWFARYAAFAAYHADLAARSGAQALILGGDWVVPALPGGKLADGSSSGVPSDAEPRWRAILENVRSHYSGPIYWAVSYPGNLDAAPSFARELDGIYLLWYAPMHADPNPSLDQMKLTAGTLLDSEILPFQTGINKPVIIAAAYPSAQGASQAVYSLTSLMEPGNTQAPVDLQAQADIYQALMMAVNERSWVSGFVSRGFNPAIALQDASISVRGKLAADVLWYWYARFRGIR
jgi:hypothetical protein